MRAAVFHGPGDLRVEDVPDPAPAAGELLLEVHAAGICGTDADEYAHGPVQFPIHDPHPVTGHCGPMVPGHEIAGRVVAAGADTAGFAEGDLVASGGGIACGDCPPCRARRTNLCERYATVGLQRHGGLAQYVAVPASTCRGVERFGLTGDSATLAQPMSIAVHAMRQGRPVAGEQVVVIGVGGIGAFLTYALAEMGAEVVVADLVADRLRVAKALGAVEAVQPDDPDALVEEVRDRAVSPTAVYEVTGAASALTAALEIIRPGGRVVAVGLHESPRALDLRAFTLREIELIGTMAHVCSEDLPEALRLLGVRRQPWSDVAPLALPLDRLVPDGLVPLVEGRAPQIKTLVDPWALEPRSTVHSPLAAEAKADGRSATPATGRTR